MPLHPPANIAQIYANQSVVNAIEHSLQDRKIKTYCSRIVQKAQIPQQNVVIVYSEVHGATRYRSVVIVECCVFNNKKYMGGIESQSTAKVRFVFLEVAVGDQTVVIICSHDT